MLSIMKNVILDSISVCDFIQSNFIRNWCLIFKVVIGVSNIFKTNVTVVKITRIYDHPPLIVHRRDERKYYWESELSFIYLFIYFTFYVLFSHSTRKEIVIITGKIQNGKGSKKYSKKKNKFFHVARLIPYLSRSTEWEAR